jgi:hypothetical protein
LLAKLARIYGVPAKVLLTPEPTAQERLDELALAGGALEREDWLAEPEGDPAGAGEPGDEPRTPPR